MYSPISYLLRPRPLPPDPSPKFPLSTISHFTVSLLYTCTVPGELKLGSTPSMATEEATKPAPLPPYPEMILAAIEALDDKNSSNKSAISSYIEGKYGDLPPAHASLLTAHLARMKETGELVFSKNNYSRADAPGAPPKRGRGRPPKPKDPSAPAATPAARDPASSPRPRGRPPKPKDPVADAVAKATSGMPRARGRPPKKAKVVQKAPIGAPASAPSAASTVAVKRGRGRPPKARNAAEPAAA